jgi:membrane protein implicated in regulation of membrane protease activity/transcriptional regulator with XRE-family HTH domain
MSFGARLQQLRHSRGVTQEEFAQQLNVSRQAVSKWESGKGYPEVDKLVFICNRYAVTMDELFADEVAVPQSSAQEPVTAQGRETTLKHSFGNFVSNLSPGDQWSLFAVVGSVLTAVAVLLILLFTSVSKGVWEDMTLKVIWLVLLILFSVGEAITVGLTSAWFALGSLGALICAALGGGIWVQIGVFLLVSGLTLALVRPLAKRFLTPGYSATNADRVIGQEAVVLQEIDNRKGQGQVSVAGQTWTARSQSGETIPEGQSVRVLRIEGVKVFVEPWEQ